MASSHRALPPATEECKDEIISDNVNPSITFHYVDSLPETGALFIEAFDEIFTELDKVETESILNCIEDTIFSNPHLITYFNVAPKIIDDMIELTRDYLPAGSLTEQVLAKQLEHKITRTDWLAECKARKIQSSMIGGVYQKYCVWSAAQELGKKIFAKQLGGETHPNIRFVDLLDETRFENVIILEPICQGFRWKEDFSFSQYLCFPSMREFSMLLGNGLREQGEAKIKSETPGLMGESFQQYYSDATHPQQHTQLHKIIQKCIDRNLEMELKNSHSSRLFAKAPTIDAQSKPKFPSATPAKR